MTLPNDVARCMGEWSSETYGAVNCSKRGTCARYTMRDTGGERTPFYASMCPGKDGYYQHFIEVTPCAAQCADV